MGKKVVKVPHPLRFGDEVGYVLEETYCDYLGSVPIDQPSGPEVCLTAVKKIKGLKQKAKKVRVLISPNGIYIIDDRSYGERERPEIIKGTPIKEVSFISLDPTGKDKKMFMFISNNTALKLITCYVFKGKDKKLVGEVPVVIHEAFQISTGKMPMPKVEDGIRRRSSVAEAQAEAKKAAADAAAKGLKKRTVSVVDDSVVGSFECKYLAGVAVSEKKGEHITSLAWSEYKESPRHSADSGDPVILQISSEGVKMIDGLTQEILGNIHIKEISFTTVMGDGSQIFCFINENPMSNRVVCHMYRCAGETAFDLAEAVGEAFKKAHAEAVENADPFKVKAADEHIRTPCPPEMRGFQISRKTLVATKAIGAGQFGQVYLGTVENTKTGAIEKCAVKTMRSSSSDEDKKEFVHECAMMLKLQTPSAHPNIVHLKGCAIQQKPWLCVLEFMQWGDMRGIMLGCAEKDITVTAYEMMNFGHQIAMGMLHLSSLNLVHMDLAARNVLLHTDSLCKVADMGITRELDKKGEYIIGQGAKLPMKWLSPEAMDSRTFSVASDVWAFGVTLWEIFSYGEMPYLNYKNSEVQSILRDGYRMSKPESAETQHHDLMKACWAAEPKARPRFDAIAKTMVELMARE